MKLGVFDSGVGGVTVLNDLRLRHPEVQFLYFGDTANVPYGPKGVAQIRTLSQSAAERIKRLQVDALVVACNTASSLALDEIRRVMAPVPVLGVVDAGVDAVLAALRVSSEPNLPILILGTRATIKSGIYARLLTQKSGVGQSVVSEQECPLLVPMIEEGWVAHPILKATVAEYVKNYSRLKPGIALLACTHYPWIREAFEEALPGWKIIDSAEAITESVGKELHLGSGKTVVPTAWPVLWYFSDPQAVSKRFVGEGQVLNGF